MPPTIVVENGTLVAGANSFVSVANVRTWCTDRLIDLGTATDNDIASALLRTSDYLKNWRRFRYRGSVVAYTQGMPLPRLGLTARDGTEIPSNVVPQAFPDAQCALVPLALKADLQPVQTRDTIGVKRKRIEGAIETDWYDTAPAEDLVVVVQGLLAPYLLFPDEPDPHTPYGTSFDGEDVELDPALYPYTQPQPTDT